MVSQSIQEFIMLQRCNTNLNSSHHFLQCFRTSSKARVNKEKSRLRFHRKNPSDCDLKCIFKINVTNTNELFVKSYDTSALAYCVDANLKVLAEPAPAQLAC